MNGAIKVFKKNPWLTVLGTGLLLCGSAMAALSASPIGEDKVLASVTQVQQNLFENSSLSIQAKLLESHQYTLYRNTYTRNADTPQTLFERLGIDDAQALEFMRTNPMARLVLSGKKNTHVTAEVTPDGTLISLKAGLRSQTEQHFNRITIQNIGEGKFSALSETVPVETVERVAMGTITYSLYGATSAIGLSDNISIQLADVFDSRIDFTRQLRRGDTFQLVYESYEADGEPFGTGRILAAQFINGERRLDAVWFQPDPNEKGSYYTFDGQSLRMTFLAYPLEYTRVSSTYGRRLHPILNTWRNHNGIDYAAPTGTPIRTVADGRVEFAGVQNGFGNIVIISHDNKRTTAYAHMSRIDVTKGQLVSQGDLIGTVGQTGWATGPHLHFEFREDGIQRDPSILAAQSNAKPIEPELMPLFEQTARANAKFIGRVEQLMAIKTE